MAVTHTPLLDHATVARFVVDDFDLTENELVAMADPAIRHTLEDCLREILDFDDVASRTVDLWRERRRR